MKKHTRLTTALLAIIFCLSFCTFSVFADEDQGSQGPGYVDPEVPVDPPVDPEVPEDPIEPDPGTGGDVDPGTGGDVNPGDGDGDTDNNDNQSSYGDGGYSGGSDYYYEDPEYNNDYSDIYVGGGQVYSPPISTAPSANLYDTDKNRIDINELSNNDWNDIKARLLNAENSEDDGVGDFSFIQKNNSSNDNGHWIVIAGVACVLLGLTGVIYIIASSVSRRKKIGIIPSSSGRQAESSGSSHYRASNDYDDGYKAQSKSEYKNSSRSKGGKRYK